MTDNDRGTHCYREILEHKEPDGTIVRTEMYLCGRLGPPCYVCGAVSTALCDFPIGDEERTCDRALCESCAPTIGHNKNFCPEHTEQGAGPNMLLFKRPPPTRAELNELAKKSWKKPRLPKAPPPDRRFRLRRRDPGGDYVVTSWTDEWDAHKDLKALKNPELYYIETWDEFVAWHRKTYPLAPRKPRPRKPPR